MAETEIPADVKALVATAISNAAVASQNHVIDVGHDDLDEVLFEALWNNFEQAIMADRAARAPDPSRDGLVEAPVAWLRDLQPDAEDEALAVCIKGDPGSFPVYVSHGASNE